MNYQGAVVMEPFVMPGGEVGSNINVFRNLGAGYDIDTEARNACKFIRSKLQVES
jgi:D-psicose/D-tagatose/L-ribulose 3-epimerase